MDQKLPPPLAPGQGRTATVSAALARLRALDEAATPGPWGYSESSGAITQTAHLTRDVWVIPHRDEDMPLIAAARNALPALLRVAEAAEALNGIQRRPGADENAEYERIAAWFHRETGYIAPGKDTPARMNASDGYDAERRDAWLRWHTEKYDALRAALDALAREVAP